MFEAKVEMKFLNMDFVYDYKQSIMHYTSRELNRLSIRKTGKFRDYTNWFNIK